MITKAVLYARVSNDDRKNEGNNLESQLDMCRDYALKNGWQVVEEPAENDRGASGANHDLPQLNKAKAKRGRFIAHGRAPYGCQLMHDGDKYQLEKCEVLL